MRQKPWSSSETHQLVCNQIRPLGWVRPESNRIARLAASCAGVPTAGLSLPIWLLTQGGGLGGVLTGFTVGVLTHGSWVIKLEALYSQDLPVLGKVPATAGGGASMIGSVVTVMSSMKSPVGRPVFGSRRAVGVAVWMKLRPNTRLYSWGIVLGTQGGATLAIAQGKPLWFQICILSALNVS